MRVSNTLGRRLKKGAARIWLKVMDVRAERLQDITIEQIVKEGIN